MGSLVATATALLRLKSFNGQDKKAGNGEDWLRTALPSFVNYVAGIFVAPDAGEARMTQAILRRPFEKFDTSDNERV
jgi:hypothetical protein